MSEAFIQDWFDPEDRLGRNRRELRRRGEEPAVLLSPQADPSNLSSANQGEVHQRDTMRTRFGRRAKAAETGGAASGQVIFPAEAAALGGLESLIDGPDK